MSQPRYDRWWWTPSAAAVVAVAALGAVLGLLDFAEAWYFTAGAFGGLYEASTDVNAAYRRGRREMFHGCVRAGITSEGNQRG